MFIPVWDVKETRTNAETVEPIALVAGPGCTSVDAQTARCRAELTEGAVVAVGDLRDFDDEANLENACGPYFNDENFACVAHVEAGDGDDTVVANRWSLGRSYMYGGNGNDELHGGECWAAHLHGGDGDDVLFGRKTADDVANGGQPARYVLNENLVVAQATTASSPDGGNDAISGGAGDDLIYGGVENRL